MNNSMSTSLPVVDSTLDCTKADIFSPLTVEPYGLQNRVHPAIADTSSFSPAAPTITAPKPSPSQDKTNDLYCRPCKKKFTNKATWENHLKSAKHIANEKKTMPMKKVVQQREQSISVECPQSSGKQ
ncbi:hypothetical protein BDF14DRAFT_1280804 [Spinellus fusiger]|nr:hypothetical protein BDF14DRAFT_1280804 [Spinellus fusiger]